MWSALLGDASSLCGQGEKTTIKVIPKIMALHVACGGGAGIRHNCRTVKKDFVVAVVFLCVISQNQSTTKKPKQ